MVGSDVDNEARRLGRMLWNYLRVGAALERREALVVFGGHDLRVAEHAARLHRDGWAPLLVLSGGLGYYTRTIWNEPEAHKFRRIALEMGVAPGAIIIEDRSRNSGENVLHTREVLAARGIVLTRAICVQKPYLERRVLLTLARQWPDCDFLMASPPIAYDEYARPDIIDTEKLVHELVGQVDRVEKYPALGYTTEVLVPPDVQHAKQRLVELGYSGHLVPAHAATT